MTNPAPRILPFIHLMNAAFGLAHKVSNLLRTTRVCDSLLFKTLVPRQHHHPAIPTHKRKRTAHTLPNARQEIHATTRFERMQRRTDGARVSRTGELHEREEGSVLGGEDM